jgi:hypothetical protein
VDDDAFTLSGGTRPADLDTLQLLAAYVLRLAADLSRA